MSLPCPLEFTGQNHLFVKEWRGRIWSLGNQYHSFLLQTNFSTTYLQEKGAACVVAQHALRRVWCQPWCSWCKPFESLNKFGKGSLPFYYVLDSANYAQAHLISFIFFTLHPLELNFSEQPLMISLEGTARAWLCLLWSARDPKRFTFWNPGINIMIHLRDGT